MTSEWLETVRALAHKSMLGKLLAIAPPGGDESKSMRRRLDLLADFAQGVIESIGGAGLFTTRSCRKCGGKMFPGIALENTTTGSPDFIGGSVVTVSTSERANLVGCMKCEKCGHSVSCTATSQGTHSEPLTQDRRTGPPDRRLAQLPLPYMDYLRLPLQRFRTAFGRRSTDKR
jgi:hypothetical protein